MRKILAILVCKLVRFVGKLVGKGSSLPGKYALKVCPDILSRVQLPPYIIAVTGSNGKTSTVEMIAAILTAAGKEVVYNKEGSNQIEGVTTLILNHSTLGGKMRGDVLLLESDERYAKYSFKFFHPTHFVITNLYRDQLTRNGHPEWVYDAILPAIHPDTTLVLNADDPLVSCFAKDHAPDKVKWFGLEECSVSTKEHQGAYHDGARCPVCKGKMEYTAYHYAHIGRYSCPNCGHKRHDTDFTVTALDLEEGKLTVNGETEISLAFKSIYNVYNILAAWSVCSLVGADSGTMAGVINNYILKNGRMVTFTLGKHKGTLLTSKHENSVAYDTNLSYIAATKKPCTVMVIVDAISRKYFTGETSWLWDIDFDKLSAPHIGKVILCGKYCNDLALRFRYTGIPAEKLAIVGTVKEAHDLLLAEGGEDDLYVVTCFSDRDKLLGLVQRDA
ncbi:MAG: MurT ligase domain-containing protein [Oscillospiraceae bacterium]|nr:MurT ligase domain-containing protein [Oscillospiraceae bacterium]